MHAKQGDQIVIDTTTLDALRRHGEVIEVIGQGEREHYRIRWRMPQSRRALRSVAPRHAVVTEPLVKIGLTRRPTATSTIDPRRLSN